MFLGRSTECALLERTLTDARAGVGRSLLVRGPPGVGKTVLLRWTAEQASGMWLVRSDCHEQHTSWAFSGLRSIVEPLVDTFADLQDEQAAALRGMLGRGPASVVDPRGLGASIVGLLSAAAQRAPLLVLVDDVHWIDSPSREALGFALGRLEHDRVAVLLSARDTEPDPFAGEVESLEVPGLAPIDAAILLGDRVAPRVAEDLAARTAGNPLALLELARELTEEQRRGVVALGDVLPLGDALARAFARRAETLSVPQRRVLLLAAAEPSLRREQLVAASDAAGFPESTVSELIAHRLLEPDVGRELRFPHPLQRSAVYQSATAAERRDAHRILGFIFSGSDEPDRYAWHLAAAAYGPDAHAAHALELAARAARARGDGTAAGGALVEAARLSSDDAARARFLAGAGSEYALAGDNASALHAYDEALTHAEDAGLRAEITLRLVAPRLQVRGPDGLHDEMLAVAAEAEPSDVEQAALLTAMAAVPAFASGDLRAARAVGERAAILSGGPQTLAGMVATILLAIAGALAGDVDENVKVLLAYADSVAPLVGSPDSFGSTDLVAGVLTWLGEFSAASCLVSALVDAAREQASVGALALALAIRSDLYFRTGHWPAARADAVESLELAHGVPRIPSIGYSQLAVARMDAVTGRAQDARRRGTDAMRLGRDLGLGSVLLAGHGILGLLELGELRLGPAGEHLEAASAIAEREGLHLLMAVPWAPDLVEVHLRVGRSTEAAELVARLVDQGAAAQGSLASGVLSRCRGLVAGSDYEEHFRHALTEHAAVSCPFVRARTDLCFGERLRRDRRDADAAAHLRDAVATFRRLGATPWLRRATTELEASGASAPSPERGRHAGLTPQEFRVAVRVGRGETSRKAAAALFLSPRTVDHHLQGVYRKLGLRSRTELVERVAHDPEFARDPEVGVDPPVATPTEPAPGDDSP